MPGYDPDLVLYHVPKEKYNFTPAQLRMIEDNHDFIFKWLDRRRLEHAEYYDVVVWGFLSGIIDYEAIEKSSEAPPRLHSVLTRRMSQCLIGYTRFQNTEARCAHRYTQSFETFNNPIDRVNSDGNNDAFDYSIFSHDKSVNIESQVEARLFLNVIFNCELLCDKDEKILRLLLLGYEPHEITKIMKGKSLAYASNALYRIRNKLKPFIPSEYVGSRPQAEQNMTTEIKKAIGDLLLNNPYTPRKEIQQIIKERFNCTYDKSRAT